MSIRLGCIADDITGGTDIAIALSAHGLKVIQILGGTDQNAPDADAVVISLKIRTAPKQVAVTAASQACKTLQSWGAEQIYFKYCSTFDSTTEGNIGPIAEALAHQLDAQTIPFVPSFPANGRTVRHGHLYVNGQLLSESPMRHHPLTPMTESNLCKHLGAQLETARVELIPVETIERGPDAVNQALEACADAGANFLVMDSITQAHLTTIAQACSNLPLLTGGSAFGGALVAKFARIQADGAPAIVHPHHNGPIVILSGSCSAASLEQVNRAAQSIPVVKLTMASDIETLLDEAQSHLSAGVVCISSTTSPEEVADTQSKYGKGSSGDKIEQMFGDIAIALYDVAVRTFIIGGGETSGAVAAALSLNTLEVGPEIAPGVPWMMDTDQRGVNVAFKSGNFGGPDFFMTAIDSLKPARNNNDLNA